MTRLCLIFSKSCSCTGVMVFGGFALTGGLINDTYGDADLANGEVLSQKDRSFGVELGDLSPVRVLVPAYDYLEATRVLGQHMDDAGEVVFACPSCGEAFNFTPKLGKGDLVGGQYEVIGALAHGGLGWIYLAVDRAVSDRWVVLKGLLDTGDQDASGVTIVQMINSQSADLNVDAVEAAVFPDTNGPCLGS